MVIILRTLRLRKLMLNMFNFIVKNIHISLLVITKEIQITFY